MKKRLLPGALIFTLGVLSLAASPWRAWAGITAQAPQYEPATLADPADWPMYGHDPQRTNFNPAETTINIGNVANLVQLWHFNLGNTSPTSSAPNVANGRVYAASSITSGDNFYALDAATGGVDWSTSVGHGYNCFNVGVGSTAAISGTVLTVGGGDQAFYGLNADTGAQLWREPMNVGASGFPWASGLLANGRAYLGMASCADNPSVRGEVRSVDMNDGGTPLQQYFVPAGNGGAGIWNSPAISPDGSKLVVVTGEDYGGYNGPYNRALVSLDAITMQILQANQQGPTGGDVDYATTPLFFSDNLGRTLVGAVHKNSIFYAYELNSINSGPIWSKSIGSYTAGMMPAYDPTFGAGGTLFVANATRVYALNPADGTDRWPYITSASLHGNLAVANGLLFLNRGGLLEIRNESTGAIVRTITPTTTGGTYTGPIVSHGVVYWLSGGWLNAWGLPSGAPTSTPVPSTSTPLPTFTTIPTGTPVPTNTVLPSATTPPSSTSTQTAFPTSTVLSTSTPTLTTATPPVATATTCTITFSDVPPGSTFYAYIRCLACIGVVNGYSDGTFRPGNNVTRGQLSKIVANSAGLAGPPGPQLFEDVAPGTTFFTFAQRLALNGYLGGYPCGGPGEPCGLGNLPYFRPNANATRGQISKVTSNAAGLNDPPGPQLFEDVPVGFTFYEFIQRLATRGYINGYPCGGPGEPCGSGNLPYFRPNSNTTRGQTAKIVSNTFFTSCDPPR